MKMNFGSCIKMPVSRNEISPEKEHSKILPKDPAVSIYNDLIAIANSVLGQGNWSHAVTSQTVDFVEYVMGKYHIGCVAFVRVQLADGTFHEDMGYSNAESSVKGSAIYSARVASITYALRKALLCFGGIVEEKIVQLQNHPRKKVKNGESVAAVNGLKESEKSEPSTSRSRVISSRAKSPDLFESEAIRSRSPARSEETKTLSKQKLPPAISSVVVIERTKSSTISSPQATKTVLKVNNVAPSVNLDSDGGSKNPLYPANISEEELMRLERKRKQKQKQEEFRKLMKEKASKSEDKPNPKF